MNLEGGKWIRNLHFNDVRDGWKRDACDSILCPLCCGGKKNAVQSIEYNVLIELDEGESGCNVAIKYNDLCGMCQPPKLITLRHLQ